MSLYWRKCKTNFNIDLPKKIMRPFWHPVAETLDDKIFSTVLHHQKPKYIPYLVLALALGLYTYSIVSALKFFKLNNEAIIWSDDKIYAVSSYALIAVMATFLLFIFSKMLHQRNVEFNRKEQKVLSFKNSLLPHHCDHDYNDLLGAIECYKNPIGKRKSYLVLKHATEKHKIILCYTYNNPQQLVGYWSFIAQYMKKDEPLPDVAALHDYPDKIEGVGTNSLQY